MSTSMDELMVPSSDGSLQPSLFYDAGRHRPLLVGLHTWSYDRFNQVDTMLPLAQKHGWSLLLPEFRGPNLEGNPHCRDACGSPIAKRDILDAVAYVTDRYAVDTTQILLLGASGGGHMALLMAAEAPLLWRGVCSFVPITDLSQWERESPSYAPGIRACCGGDEAEYRARSPISYVDEIAKANVKIFTGKWDDTVPCHHGLDLYNKIFISHPEANVYFDMFDGGHEMLLDEAERFFLSQMQKEMHSVVTG